MQDYYRSYRHLNSSLKNNAIPKEYSRCLSTCKTCLLSTQQVLRFMLEYPQSSTEKSESTMTATRMPVLVSKVII